MRPLAGGAFAHGLVARGAVGGIRIGRRGLFPGGTALLVHPLAEAPLLEEGLFVAGPLALFLAELEMKEQAAIGLLTYATRGRPDPRSAATMLEKINEVYGVEANVEQLLEESREIERLEKMRKSIESADRPGDMFV